MEMTRFDRNLWRFNGIVIALACLGVLCITGYLIARYVKDKMEVQATNVVNVSPEGQRQEQTTIGDLSPIQGTPFLLATASGQQAYGQDYYSKSTMSTRNYLLYDTRHNTAKWLMKDQSALFVDYHNLYDSIDSAEPANGVPNMHKESAKAKVVAILLDAVLKDSNGDKRLNYQDKHTLLYLNLGSGELKPLMEYDASIGLQQISNDDALVLSHEGEKNYVTRLKIRDGELGTPKLLPPVPR